ncbi:MAG: 50S ribosomal protein L13 [Bacteroidia bacterium]|nr:50S ribosomal protein L13 [Bacteroidia bacterium]
MNTPSYKTVFANRAAVKQNWVLVDAEDQPVGRLCSKIAYLVKGKNKTYYTPNTNCGDHVVVINAEKVKFTGNKVVEKQYVRHTDYPGGQRFATPKEMLAKRPEFIIERAVKKMLPKNKLGNDLFRNLHVYSGTAHPHEAQAPKKLDLSKIIAHNKI